MEQVVTREQRGIINNIGCDNYVSDDLENEGRGWVRSLMEESGREWKRISSQKVLPPKNLLITLQVLLEPGTDMEEI